MLSSNTCSICSLFINWFPWFYCQMELDNRKQQISLRPQCGIARLTIYFLNLSPVNANLTSLSYVHTSPQTIMRPKIVVNVRRMAYATETHWLQTYTKVSQVRPSSRTAVYPHMPILRVAITLDKSDSACHWTNRPILGFLGSLWGWKAKFPKMWDFPPRTPTNHRAKFDAVSFILGGEIINSYTCPRPHIS